MRRSAFRTAFPIAFCLTLVSHLCGAGEAEKSPPVQLGITDVKPTSGRFVQIGDQFMVPYTAKIPGTRISYEMIPIPAGRLVMGSPADEVGRKQDEGPQVPVRVDAFWIGKCEVTWGEYKQYMGLYPAFKKFRIQGIRRVNEENKADAVSAPTVIYAPDLRFRHGDQPSMPAASMSQFGAKQYTHWLSGVTQRFYRLPSEAEWEYACRAGSKTAFHFADMDTELTEYSWFVGNSDDSAHFVGCKRPNAWGLHDMHGNVSEWVLDAHSPDGYEKLEMGGVAADVICWPAKRLGRVVRGGSFLSPAADCRSAARTASGEDWWEYDPNLPQSPWWMASDEALAVGFRIVRPWNVPPKKERHQFWGADCDDLREALDDRINEGRGVTGLVDRELPEAIERLSDK